MSHVIELIFKEGSRIKRTDVTVAEGSHWCFWFWDGVGQPNGDAIRIRNDMVPFVKRIEFTEEATQVATWNDGETPPPGILDHRLTPEGTT
jgi:hypothetical protein